MRIDAASICCGNGISAVVRISLNFWTQNSLMLERRPKLSKSLRSSAATIQEQIEAISEFTQEVLPGVVTNTLATWCLAQDKIWPL